MCLQWEVTKTIFHSIFIQKLLVIFYQWFRSILKTSTEEQSVYYTHDWVYEKHHVLFSPNSGSWYCWLLGLKNSVWGTSPCNIGCLAASLASTYQTVSSTHDSPSPNIQQMSPDIAHGPQGRGGANSPPAGNHCTEVMHVCIPSWQNF